MIGFSFGGVFAFEIAQRFNMPDKIDLVLIDTPVPEYGNLNLWNKLRLDIRAIIAQLREVKIFEIGFIHEKFIKLLRRVKYNLYPKLKLNMSNMEKKDIEALFHSAALRILTKIRLKPYDGSLILFRATESSSSIRNNFSWDKYALRGVDTYYLKGNHSTILSEQNIIKMTSIIQNYVERH